MCPRADLTAPVPWQCAQADGVTCSWPMPWQVAQYSCRVTVTVCWPPRIASAKLERHRLMQIDAALRRPLRPPRLALVQDVGEQIAERRRLVAVHADREVEAVEAEGRTAVRFRPRAGGVVLLPALGVAQRLVGVGDLTELRRGHPVTGVDVRMVFPREPLVGALDVGQRRPTLDTEDEVEIHF